MATAETDNPDDYTKAPVVFELPRDAIERVLAEHCTDPTVRQAACKHLIKTLHVSLMADGYTFAMASAALGVPESTLRGWADRDKDFGDGIAAAREHQRNWLLGTLRLQLAGGGKAAGQAANVLSNLYFPELRTSKVHNVHSSEAAVPYEETTHEINALLAKRAK